MPIFQPKNFLFASLFLLSANPILSALNFPVVLPSGQTIHLNLDGFDVNSDTYSVSLYTVLNDPEEERVFSENPETIKIMGKSIEKDWEFHNIKFKLYDPNEFKWIPLNPVTIDIFQPSPLILPSLDIKPYASAIIVSPSGVASPFSYSYCAGSVILQSGTLTLTNTSILTNPEKEQQPIDTTLIIKEGGINGQNVPIPSSNDDKKNANSEKNLPTSPNSTALFTPPSESDEVTESSQNKTNKHPIFKLTFETFGENLGGGWRLMPFDLRFIKKRVHFGDDVEELALVLAPRIEELYQKEYNKATFSPLDKADISLKDNLDNTFTVSAPFRGEYIFNRDGQLIHAINKDNSSSHYDYFNGQLVAIHHTSGLELSIEYDEKKAVQLNGFPHKMHLQYDDQGKLCKISDEQGAFIQFTYDDEDLDNIIDDSGVRFSIYSSNEITKNGERIIEASVLFNGYGEIFYYKNQQDIWKFSYRSWSIEADKS